MCEEDRVAREREQPCEDERRCLGRQRAAMRHRQVLVQNILRVKVLCSGQQ